MLNSQEVKRGQIYYADMPDSFGSEQGGHRPVLIIQNNMVNKYSGTTLIAPLTTKRANSRLPTHVFVKAKEHSLACDSTALLEQVRVIDRARLKNYITHLDHSRMLEVNAAISVSFGMDSPLTV